MQSAQQIHGFGQYVVVIVNRRLSVVVATVLAAHLLQTRHLIAVADTRGALVLVHDHIRLHARILDRTTAWRVIASGGQFYRAPIAQRQNRLHGAFTEGRRAHDHRALVVLQRTGDDLGSRGRTAVDQYHHWGAVEHIARLGVEHDFIAAPALRVNDPAALD